MAKCECCGNSYDKCFEVIDPRGGRHTFDSFECAIKVLAPNCAHCGVKILGHGVEAGDEFFCCAHCARNQGVQGVADHV
jgi:hypothetical protein